MGAQQEMISLMQMQADIAGVPVIRPAQTETTALGAAFLAGLASGFGKVPTKLPSLWRAERVFEPVMNEDQERIFDEPMGSSRRPCPQMEPVIWQQQK